MASHQPNDPSSPPDRSLARLEALGVVAAVVGLLGYLHRRRRLTPR